MNPRYLQQVKLLVRVIPYIAQESCFALKGGTAINLFYREMPRLSVDIDLVYLGLEKRQEALSNIRTALANISGKLAKAGMQAEIKGSEDHLKLIVSDGQASIKVEPNPIIRACLLPPEERSLAPSVEKEFGFASMKVLSPAELFGGKMCAALDRQHPRDLFDVAFMLKEGHRIPNLFDGFVSLLFSHARPALDLLDARPKNQLDLYSKEFQGMTDLPFSYQDHIDSFSQLLRFVQEGISTYQDFILKFFALEPIQESPLPVGWERLPAIQWKRENLMTLKQKNQKKFEEQWESLKNYFTRRAPSL